MSSKKKSSKKRKREVEVPKSPVISLNRPLPTWFHESKFGIFIHWGVYSVPAFASTKKTTSLSKNCAEWYLRKLKNPFSDYSETKNHHLAKYGSKTYEDFASEFTASKWEPSSWAKLFRRSGAKYVVFTAKHHDGFCNWPTKNPSKDNWFAPRDFVGQLKQQVEKEGLRFGIYYSLYEWYNSLYLSDKRSSTCKYVDRVVWPQLKELVLEYHPSLVWVDGDWEQSSAYWRAQQFLEWLYQQLPATVSNDRWGNDAKTADKARAWGIFSNPTDRYFPGKPIGYKYECCLTMGRSWGYNAEETEFYSSEELVKMMITAVCCGGNFLLNVGPRADGTIPEYAEQRLEGIGAWMETHGDSIFDSDPCGGWDTLGKHSYEPGAQQMSGVWYSQSATSSGTYYAFLLDTDDVSNTLEVSVLKPNKNASTHCKIKPGEVVVCDWKMDNTKTIVQLPALKTTYPIVLKLTDFTLA